MRFTSPRPGTATVSVLPWARVRGHIVWLAFPVLEDDVQRRIFREWYSDREHSFVASFQQARYCRLAQSVGQGPSAFCCGTDMNHRQSTAIRPSVLPLLTVLNQGAGCTDPVRMPYGVWSSTQTSTCEPSFDCLAGCSAAPRRPSPTTCFKFTYSRSVWARIPGRYRPPARQRDTGLTRSRECRLCN